VNVAIPWLVWDDENEEHIARHGISVCEVNQVIGNPHLIARNPKRDDGSRLLIGRTDGGRTVTVAVVPTEDPSAWRPVTAFDATPAHRTLLRRHIDDPRK